MQSRADVLIIGAGVSGMCAARELSAAGLRIVIVEARDRIGGRVFTRNVAGFPLPVELGAEFVHGTPPEIWNVADTSGLPLIALPDRHIMFERGSIKPAGEFWDELDTISARMRRLKNRDISLSDFLAAHCGERRMAKACAATLAYVEGFHAARADRISIESLIKSEDAEEELGGGALFRMMDGYVALIDELRNSFRANGVEIHLNTAVQSVKWKRGAVTVVAATKKFDAKAVLITLPLGVLQAHAHAKGAVAFEPELPRKQDAARRLAMGPALRVSLCFKTPFWENLRARKGVNFKEMQFIHSPDAELPTWWTLQPVRAPILTGWAGGPAAERLSAMSEAAVLDKALKTLAKIFKLPHRQISALLTAHATHNWTADPFSRGAYSYVPVGAQDAPGKLGMPVEKTLYFAGEATDTSGNTGTVHGAMGTGLRAAKEILRDLKRREFSASKSPSRPAS